MLIRSLDQSFTVIQLLGRSDRAESYLCRDYASQDPSDHLLVRLMDPELITRMVPVFLDLRQQGMFLDFEDSFSNEDGVYGVFRYSGFPTWEQKRDREGCGLPERLEIAKNVLEKMLLYRMPPYFQKDVLAPGRVCVAPSLEIGFRYGLEDIAGYFSVTAADACQSFQAFFGELFYDELEQPGKSPELEDFVRDCPQAGSLEELYRRFIPLYQGLRAPAEGQKKKKAPPRREGRAFRVWERIKQIARFLRPFVAAAVLIAVVLYLIFTWDAGSEAAKDAGTFTQIGTVEITE